ncbi:MAG: IS110 family transposase, partial [Caulobacteraceae bacterium]
MASSDSPTYASGMIEIVFVAAISGNERTFKQWRTERLLMGWTGCPLSKRGDKYLRMLFIQAAKVLLMRPQTWERFSFG